MRNVALFSLLVSALPLCAQAKSPVVVELYTAQGCASCGQANAYVGKLAEKPGVLALTFSVDYWDYLGWEDTFAGLRRAAEGLCGPPEPARTLHPQVVIDGRAQVGGLQDDKIDKLVSDAAHAGKRGPDMAFIGQRRVDVGSGVLPRGGAEVWLVRYDPREQDVAVRKGDNKGQTVPHRNVVVEIKRLGAWRGRPTAYRMPAASAEGLATAVIVQSPHGGRVLAAAQKD
uniref:DUF1223 domain-containing protein n=1 Tax=Phenylobacterium glaciei TaxID=2803784 RepID=A0A974P490_9CAUL|nr:DUF1223 domain-containing protein [Phenylobacterium glaciei]